MKSATYIAEMTTQKAEKYLSEGRKLGSTCLPACLLTSCQRRNFPREFTEKSFAIFDQSSHMIYLTWYWSALFFQEFSSIISFMVWLQDSSQIKWRRYIFLSSIIYERSAEVIFLKKHPVFHFLDLDGTVLNLI